MPNEVLQSVRELLPAIAERAQTVDESRRVSDQTIRDLTAAGVFRMLQPARYGGLETSPVDFYEVVRAISGVCGSTGWVTSVLGVHPWHLALFDVKVQDEVWGQDTSTLVSSAYAPVGELVPVEGGYELSGSWRFSSGCDHASWALLGGLVVGAEGRPVDFMTVLVPRTDYRSRTCGTSSDCAEPRATRSPWSGRSSPSIGRSATTRRHNCAGPDTR